MKQATLLFALLVAHAATTSFAQSASATATGSATAQAATFRCGGVGEDEQRSMKAEAAQHDLLLSFASASGAYLADIDVEIRRGGNVVLQGRCSGPLMLVNLAPAGSYEIVATSQGQAQRRSVQVGGAKGATVAFRWPER